VTDPNYTPEVKRAADVIRRAIQELSLSELVALRDVLSDDWPINPLAGVREPRRPSPDDREGAATFEEELREKLQGD
jgi:hypothetical protein